MLPWIVAFMIAVFALGWVTVAVSSLYQVVRMGLVRFRGRKRQTSTNSVHSLG